MKKISAASLMLLLSALCIIKIVKSKPQRQLIIHGAPSTNPARTVLHSNACHCVRRGTCNGHVFGRSALDVALYGTVPPCRNYGWQRCCEKTPRGAELVDGGARDQPKRALFGFSSVGIRTPEPTHSDNIFAHDGTRSQQNNFVFDDDPRNQFAPNSIRAELFLEDEASPEIGLIGEAHSTTNHGSNINSIDINFQEASRPSDDLDNEIEKLTFNSLDIHTIDSPGKGKSEVGDNLGKEIEVGDVFGGVTLEQQNHMAENSFDSKNFINTKGEQEQTRSSPVVTSDKTSNVAKKESSLIHSDIDPLGLNLFNIDTNPVIVHFRNASISQSAKAPNDTELRPPCGCYSCGTCPSKYEAESIQNQIECPKGFETCCFPDDPWPGFIVTDDVSLAPCSSTRQCLRPYGISSSDVSVFGALIPCYLNQLRCLDILLLEAGLIDPSLLKLSNKNCRADKTKEASKSQSSISPSSSIPTSTGFVAPDVNGVEDSEETSEETIEGDIFINVNEDNQDQLSVIDISEHYLQTTTGETQDSSVGDPTKSFSAVSIPEYYVEPKETPIEAHIIAAPVFFSDPDHPPNQAITVGINNEKPGENAIVDPNVQDSSDNQVTKDLTSIKHLQQKEYNDIPHQKTPTNYNYDAPQNQLRIHKAESVEVNPFSTHETETFADTLVFGEKGTDLERSDTNSDFTQNDLIASSSSHELYETTPDTPFAKLAPTHIERPKHVISEQNVHIQTSSIPHKDALFIRNSHKSTGLVGDSQAQTIESCCGNSHDVNGNNRQIHEVLLHIAALSPEHNSNRPITSQNTKTDITSASDTLIEQEEGRGGEENTEASDMSVRLPPPVSIVYSQSFSPFLSHCLPSSDCKRWYGEKLSDFESIGILEKCPEEYVRCLDGLSENLLRPKNKESHSGIRNIANNQIKDDSSILETGNQIIKQVDLPVVSGISGPLETNAKQKHTNVPIQVITNQRLPMHTFSHQDTILPLEDPTLAQRPFVSGHFLRLNHAHNPNPQTIRHERPPILQNIDFFHERLPLSAHRQTHIPDPFHPPQLGHHRPAKFEHLPRQTPFRPHLGGFGDKHVVPHNAFQQFAPHHQTTSLRTGVSFSTPSNGPSVFRSHSTGHVQRRPHHRFAKNQRTRQHQNAKSNSESDDINRKLVNSELQLTNDYRTRHTSRFPHQLRTGHGKTTSVGRHQTTTYKNNQKPFKRPEFTQRLPAINRPTNDGLPKAPVNNIPYSTTIKKQTGSLRHRNRFAEYGPPKPESILRPFYETNDVNPYKRLKPKTIRRKQKISATTTENYKHVISPIRISFQTG